MDGVDDTSLKGEFVYTKLLFQSSSLCESFSDSYFAVSQDCDLSLPFLDVMLLNHRKCPYLTLLRLFCPSILDMKDGKSLTQTCKNISSKELLNNYTVMHSVYLYLRRIAKNVVPMEALGSKHNFNCFMKHIKKLLTVQLHGKISLNYMIGGIKTKSIAWLQLYTQKEKTNMMKKTIHFLIKRFICPLIQSFFIVTESTTRKNKLFFYRKKTWHRLTQLATNKFIHSCRLKKVSEQWVQSKLKEEKCLGVSSIRFLVKLQSVRPIANLSFRNKNRLSVNRHIRTLLHVLTFEKQKNPELFGATAMSTEDIHLKWSRFVTQCKHQSVKKFYFVKTDIEKCFDTINPCLLFTVISRILSRPSYKINRYKKVFHSNGEARSVYFDSAQHPNIVCSARKTRTEHCDSYVVTKDVLLRKLCALLFCNVFRLGGQYFVQTLGISQGSALSSILCGAYYAFMEHTILNDLRGELDVLIRVVDDILFVTPCKRNAQNLLKVMLEGVPEFNCKCNLSKCCINFRYHHPVFGTVSCVQSQSPVLYCGLAFDTETLNVRLDFSNYLNVMTDDTLSWDLTRNPGCTMRRKILSSVYPKCLSILFDKNINSENSIYYNILCLFSVCALKFHCLLKHLPSKQRILNNPTFFRNIICSLPEALICCSSQKLRKYSSQSGINVTMPVSKEIVCSLCFQSFLFKLRKHTEMYSSLIKQLEQMESCSKISNCISKMLPLVFKNIHIN